MLKIIERAGPARLAVKSVAYVEAGAFQGTAKGVAILTEIADEAGRTVYANLGETELGRGSEAKLSEARAKAALFADVLAKAKPTHWLALGHVTFAVDEPGTGLAAIATINANDWIVRAPYLRIKRGDAWVAASPPEIVYPLSLAHLSDGEQRVSEITRDIFAGCVRSGFYRSLTGPEAIEHSALMPT
jgi:hypothetical protein